MVECLRSRRTRDQRGGGSVLTVCVVLVLCLVGLVMAWQGSLLASEARTRSVADLVALSAARAQQTGRPACEVAELAASQNRARLSACEVTTGWGEFVVDITVEVDLVPRLPQGPRQATAQSRAGVVAWPD